MNFDNPIVKKASSFAIKHTAKLRKNSPVILVAVGVTGFVASTVLACRATIKAQDILEDAKYSVEAVHTVLSDESDEVQYTEEDAKKDLAIIYCKTGINLARIYAPAVILGAASIFSVVESHRILSKRNVALAAAYTAIDRGFKEYRGRVVDRFGEAVDKELKYGTKAEKIAVSETDPETGKAKKTKKEFEVLGVDDYSDYARIYDDSCREWQPDPEYNLLYLRGQQAYANQMLQDNGRLFLNDVYKMLGFPCTKAGQIVGWEYKKDNPIGDNMIDFGIYNVKRQAARDFVNGYEDVIILDFNVDGPIIDNM